MAKRRRKSTPTADLIDFIIRGSVILAFIAYAPLVAWWNNISPTVRILLVILTVVVIVSGIGALWALNQHRKQQRALAWKRAMVSWNQSTQAGMVYSHQSARYLSDIELEKFAAQIYTQMGYAVKRTGRTGDHGVDVLLVGPQKQIELVQCKQWNKSVGEPQVRDLYGAMTHMKATRGWLWAPKGFSQPAKRWAKDKPIVLVDDEEIGRLIESAYGSKQ